MRPGENKQTRNLAGRAWRVLALGSGALLAGYGVIAATAWARFGGAHTRRPESVDAMLDRFMPTYDVVERHEVEIDAPAAIVLAAAKTQKLDRLPLVRGIFAMRQLVMGGTERQDLPAELVPQVLALGWRVLDEVPDREIVIGSVTQPWLANVVFEGIAAEAYAAFDTPGYVKIVWSLRADPLGPSRTRFSTETRAVATDAEASRRFRPYWALASPGIWLIRRLSLMPLKQRAEWRFRGGGRRTAAA